MNGKKYKFAAFACTAAMVLTQAFSFAAVGAGDVSSDEQLSNLNQQLDDLKQQQAQITENIDKIRDDKQKLEAQKENIGIQLYNTNLQIQYTEQKLQILSEDISAAESRMEELNKEIENDKKLFEERIKAIQLSGTFSTLDYIFSSESFSDFVMRIQMASQMAKHDTDIVNKLKDEVNELNELTESLNKNKLEHQSAGADLENLRVNLKDQSAAADESISEFTLMEQAFLNDRENMQAKAQQMQNEIDNIFAQLEQENQNNSSSSEPEPEPEPEPSSSEESSEDGGETSSETPSSSKPSSSSSKPSSSEEERPSEEGWIYPLPSYSYISSVYGWRFNGTDFHTGVDFAGGGIYGKPVVAAKSGTVRYVGYSPSGYGNYVIIDHGNGFSTLYGHNSQVVVSVGQHVSQGQTVAKAGNTGWVIPGPTESNPTAGTHLHFEIRINGQHTDPLPYLRG